jgi:hypothetical protein
VHTPTENKNDDTKHSFYEGLERVLDQFPKHHVKISSGYFNAKEGRENISKPAIEKKSLHKISNDNGVKVIIFAISRKNLSREQFSYIVTFKNTLRILLMGKNKQIYHILLDEKRHSNIVDVQSFRFAD